MGRNRNRQFSGNFRRDQRSSTLADSLPSIEIITWDNNTDSDA